MEVTVTDYLNVRVGSPSLAAPNYQYLAPGSILQVDGKLYKGEPYEGIDDWLKDEAGNYYWSGGVSEIIQEGNDFWFHYLKIQKIWNKYGVKGDSANVLILDSGIDDKLEVVINEKYNFTGGDVKNVNDERGHGTHCAGLIAARTSTSFVGVAPGAKLLIGKVSHKKPLADDRLLIGALNYFLDFDIDIVSISLSLTPSQSPNKDQLQAIINEYVSKNRIIFCAIGNDDENNNYHYARYPACLENVIAVGSCENNLNLAKYTLNPSKASILCFGTNIYSFLLNSNYDKLTGTSQSTAIVAGVCALVISYLKKNEINYDQNLIKTLLNKGIDVVNSYKIINPSKIFDNLEKLKNHEENNLLT